MPVYYSSPYLNHFSQPDSIIPDASNPQSFNRYSYVMNNPVKYNDPSGHAKCFSSYATNCYAGSDWVIGKQPSDAHKIQFYKDLIRQKFGVKVADARIKWNLANVQTAYNALTIVDKLFSGGLRKIVTGTTFTMTDGGNQYLGHTSSTEITFHVASTNTNIPLVNFLHETGHLIDAVPATRNFFSNPLRSRPNDNLSWVTDDGFVDSGVVGDKLGTEPIQAQAPFDLPFDEDEHWADAFANYAGGNIDLTTAGGQAMYSYVNAAISGYLFVNHLYP